MVVGGLGADPAPRRKGAVSSCRNDA